MTDLTLGPERTQRGPLAPLRLGWQVAFGAVRDFVWADLREKPRRPVTFNVKR